jgi:hypothetical protein
MKNQRWGMLPGDQKKGHLSPGVTEANEMTCDYVWEKLHLLFL